MFCSKSYLVTCLNTLKDERNTQIAALNEIISNSASSAEQISQAMDEKNRLNEMNIVFDYSISEGSPEALVFIKDCIKCFIQNEATENEILDTTDFEKSISKVNKKTISAEADNIKMEIDTTELGTVITIYKDLV